MTRSQLSSLPEKETSDLSTFLFPHLLTVAKAHEPGSEYSNNPRSPTPHHRSGSGSPSLTRCRGAPGLRRLSGSRLTPPDPEPSVAHLLRTPRLPAPDPAAWSRGRASHIFFSRGCSGARQALQQSHRLEPRAGARAPDARAAQRLPQRPPASAEQPPGAAPETRRPALASRATGGVSSGPDRSVLGGESEHGGLGLPAGAVFRSARAARLIRRWRKGYKVGAPRLRAVPRWWHRVIVDWGVSAACKGTPVPAAAASQPRSSEGHLHGLRPAPRAAAAGTRAWPTAGMHGLGPAVSCGARVRAPGSAEVSLCAPRSDTPSRGAKGRATCTRGSAPERAGWGAGERAQHPPGQRLPLFHPLGGSAPLLGPRSRELLGGAKGRGCSGSSHLPLGIP
ncbi:unnamed protein product [Rangifer tarandus platyrhynchus]|uniref:Uncharacterized protein n=1 Tax=Rangifer tarandus platyrhynchus TaxID=3082113 RepID=A0ABN8ZNI6_RANTA|nr:unnamed protein product [Rangifer tarandus platyrhynchus]